MGFGEAYQILRLRPFSFEGRASRSEFWWIALILYLAMLALLFVTVAVSAGVGAVAYLLFLVGGVALMVAQLAVSTRRLHDKGLTGWVNLLMIVPFGSFALLILWLLPGEYTANQYGPPPNVAEPDDAVYTRTNIPRVKDDD